MTVPDWLLERYALGEVTDAQRARAEADPDLPAQLAALRDSDGQIRGVYPAAATARRIQARRRPAPRRWLLPASVAVAAAAVAAVWLARGAGPPDDGHRARGLVASLEVWRQTPDGAAERLSPGAEVRAGDLLQLSVVRGDEPYGWIVSVDGAGAVTVHAGDTFAPGRTALPTAYRLDDAPGFEHFFLVTDDAPVPRADLEAAAAAVAARRDPHAPLVVPGARTVDVLVVKP